MLFRAKIISIAATSYNISLMYVEQVLRFNVSLDSYKAHWDYEDYERDLTRITLGVPLPISQQLTLGVSWSYAHIEQHTDRESRFLGMITIWFKSAMQYVTKSFTIQATAVALYYACRLDRRDWISYPAGCALSIIPLWEGFIRFRVSDGIFSQVGNVSVDSKPILRWPYIDCMFVVTPEVAVHGQLQVDVSIGGCPTIRFTGVHYSLRGVLTIGNISLGVLYQARSMSISF